MFGGFMNCLQCICLAIPAAAFTQPSGCWHMVNLHRQNAARRKSNYILHGNSSSSIFTFSYQQHAKLGMTTWYYHVLNWYIMWYADKTTRFSDSSNNSSAYYLDENYFYNYCCSNSPDMHYLMLRKQLIKSIHLYHHLASPSFDHHFQLFERFDFCKHLQDLESYILSCWPWNTTCHLPELHEMMGCSRQPERNKAKLEFNNY